jgi:hypothetical protein
MGGQAFPARTGASPPATASVTAAAGRVMVHMHYAGKFRSVLARLGPEKRSKGDTAPTGKSFLVLCNCPGRQKVTAQVDKKEKKEEKHFFFEKKKQKTFIYCHWHGVHTGELGASITVVIF